MGLQDFGWVIGSFFVVGVTVLHQLPNGCAPPPGTAYGCESPLLAPSHRDLERAGCERWMTSLEQSWKPRSVFTVHWAPGLLDSVYEAVLARALERRGFRASDRRLFALSTRVWCSRKVLVRISLWMTGSSWKYRVAGHEGRRARRAQGTKGAGHEGRRARRARGTKGVGHEGRGARRGQGTKGAGMQGESVSCDAVGGWMGTRVRELPAGGASRGVRDGPTRYG